MYQALLSRLTAFAEAESGIKALLMIGSRARQTEPADEYSDIDLVFIADAPETYLHNRDWLSALGQVKVSFLEKTVQGETELRVLFDRALDVDMVFVPTDGINEPLPKASLTTFQRGYRILVDKIELTSRLIQWVSGAAEPYRFMSPGEFDNLVQSFFYHTVWIGKKLLRGERWAAVQCLNAFMSQELLQAIELYAHALHGSEYDTWHNGRMLEQWAEPQVLAGLEQSFAHFNKQDARTALIAMTDLFLSVTTKTSELLQYAYPQQACDYCMQWVRTHCGSQLG